MSEPAGGSVQSLGGPQAALETAGTSPSRAFDALRDTIKWLMAAAAALAAVLVAGLQLSDFTPLLDAPGARQLLAVLSALVALSVVLAVVVICARILATPRLSVRDLADREDRAGGGDRRVRLEPVRDRLVQAVLERRSDLLAGHESIASLYAQYGRLNRAREDLDAGRSATIDGVVFDGATSDQLDRLLARTERKIERLEDWAQFLDAQRRFARLTRWWFVLGGLAFACAVVALTIVSQDPDDSLTISRPTPVLIQLRVDPQDLRLPESCRASQLSGFAVGGSFNEPVLSVSGPAGCGPVSVSPDQGQVVLLPQP